MRLQLRFAAPFTLLLVLLLAMPRTHAQGPTQNQAQTPLAQQQEDDADDDDGSKKEIRNELREGKFDDLDRLADHLRRDKTRIAGGEWKLARFYTALDRPMLADRDSAEHLDHLHQWMKLRPESITARIALATSLERWAWVARGHATSDKTTDKQFALFAERSHEAYIVLQGSRDMRTQDPQWYAQMLSAGLAEGWDRARMQDIFERGVQFEPGYFYLYRTYANYLLPKWYGQPGDAARFATDSANKVGGAAGDLLYFQIAGVFVRRGDGNFPLRELDWPRIQRGYDAIMQTYGPTNKHVNQLAFMAYKFKDLSLAQRQFAQIHDHWTHSVWRDREFFDKARDWSTGHSQWAATS